MPKAKRPLRVFLCHAASDKPAVEKLYKRLIKDGLDAWLDIEKLIPGQNWQDEITKVVYNSDAVIVCLSSQSITKEGFVQKEIKFALDASDEKPDGTIFIIPARLENCKVPERINKFHWVDLFSDDGYKRILKALKIRADSVGATITPLQSKKKKAKNTASVSQKTVKEKKELPHSNSVTPLPNITPPNQSELFLFASVCSFLGNELSSISTLNPFQPKIGVLRLTKEKIAFNSGYFSLDIQFGLIRRIYSRLIPPSPFTYPIDTKCIEVNYEVEILGHYDPVNVYLQPLGKPTKETLKTIDADSKREADYIGSDALGICLNINASVDNWIKLIKEIPMLSPKVKAW